MWKSLGIIQSYTQFSDLGALAALKREIPYHAQRDDRERLAEVRDVAFLVNNVAVLLAAALVLLGSAVVNDPAAARALRLFVLLLYANHVHTFLEQLLYGRKEFAYASKVNLGLSLVEAVLAVGGTLIAGLDGLILGTSCGYAMAVLVQLRRIRFSIGFAFRWAAYVDLVKIGFPSHLNGLLYNLLMSVDRMLILPVLGLPALGLYGLGMTINEYLFQFSYALGSALSPRLVERFSETRSVAALRPMVERPTLAIAAAAPALLGPVYFLSEAVVLVALPEYRGALLPLRILLAGTYFSSLHRGLSSLFLALRKQGRLLPVYAGAILLNAALVSAALAAGWGIAGVAAATSVTLMAFSLTLVTMAMAFFLEGAAAHLRFLGRLLLPLVWGAAGIAAGEAAARAAGGAARPVIASAVGVAVFAAVYAPSLPSAYRRLRAPAPAPSGA